MPRITEELIRKKAEHNEGLIFTLEELSLHQLDIEKIEHLDKWCRDLKILYLQSNLISKIENVNRLKKLQYFNLALNNITYIDNLTGCESLIKLDLTLNFITKLSSIINLSNSYNLRELFLVGNPCSTYSDYRKYVINTLPQLKSLDGKPIERSERIQAAQELENIALSIMTQENAAFEETIAKQDKLCETVHSEDSFWTKKTEHNPETRTRIYEELQKTKCDKSNAEEAIENKTKKIPRKLFKSDGKIFNVNEAKVNFTFLEDDVNNNLLLDVAVYKYLDTSLISVELQPTYVQITIRNKLLQLELPAEINPDASSVKRSQTTGHLLVIMAKASDVLTSKQMDSRNGNESDARPKETGHCDLVIASDDDLVGLPQVNTKDGAILPMENPE